MRERIKQRAAPKTTDDTGGFEAIARPFRQIGKDVVSGTRSLVSQGKAAVANVAEGYRKIRRFVGK